MIAAPWRGQGGTGRFPQKAAAKPNGKKGAHGETGFPPCERAEG
jgi:hypothetical protein